MGKGKDINLGKNERLHIENKPGRIDAFQGRKGYNTPNNQDSHDHYWVNKDNPLDSGVRLGRSFKKEPNSNTGCFLTTACVEHAGLPDDCLELETMRRFRDNYVQALPDGPQILEDYYATAPKIVQRISSSSDSSQVFSLLLGELRNVVRMIDEGCSSDAWDACEHALSELKKNYLLTTH